jgi:hypothetical protein
MVSAKLGGKLVALLWLMDGDRKRRTLINFLVYCPKGTVFRKSVDVTDSSKTVDFLFRLFKDAVNFVGPEHVAHFVSDNASWLLLVEA